MIQYALNSTSIAVAVGITAVIIKTVSDRRYKKGYAAVLGFIEDRGDERASVRINDADGAEVGVFIALPKDVRGHEDGKTFEAMYATFPKSGVFKISCRIKAAVPFEEKADGFLAAFRRGEAF